MNKKEPYRTITEVAGKLKEIMALLEISPPESYDVMRTPMRIAESWVNELFAGLYTEPPVMTEFAYTGKKQMIVIQDIHFTSLCSHHWLPYTGVAHIGCLLSKKAVGLSKFNRLVHWCAARPSMQEELTDMIGEFLVQQCKIPDVAVVMHAKHSCCTIRGPRDHSSTFKTTFLQGKFLVEPVVREEFYKMLQL